MKRCIDRWGNLWVNTGYNGPMAYKIDRCGNIWLKQVGAQGARRQAEDEATQNPTGADDTA